jgi:hypothetical protein
VKNFLGTQRGGDRSGIARVRGWVREAFELQPETRLLVTEVECGKRGCPPHETVIALLEPDLPPEEHKLRKAVAQVTEEDIARLARARSGQPALDDRTKGEEG